MEESNSDVFWYAALIDGFYLRALSLLIWSRSFKGRAFAEACTFCFFPANFAVSRRGCWADTRHGA